jgi:hypothetical protein
LLFPARYDIRRTLGDWVSYNRRKQSKAPEKRNLLLALEAGGGRGEQVFNFLWHTALIVYRSGEIS